MFSYREDMENADLTRRTLLQALAAAIGATAVPLGWGDVAAALQTTDPQHGAAHIAAAPPADAKISLLTAAEAADVEAITAQIIPTDDSPGAREAGVVFFIDRALATFFSQLADDYRAQLAAFQTTCRERHPGASSFASLSSDEQIAFLKSVDETPFFNLTRIFTLLGMFSLPAYGGNRDHVGWTLIGFEDRHIFQPPFGYYDRDYQGFVLQPVHSK